MVYHSYGERMPRALTPAETTTYDRLKQMILQGQIGHGEPLVERSMAERLGVSRTPVRETILRLEREGLVRVVEGKGAFVASYTIEDLIEIYQIREGLEPIAARLACPRLALAELRVFEKEFEYFRSDPSRRIDDQNAWLQLGRDFHAMFIEASGNQRIISVIHGLQNQIELFRNLSRKIDPHVVTRSTVEEHFTILRAFMDRDPEAAEAAVRIHLQNGLRYRIDGLSGRGPNYG